MNTYIIYTTKDYSYIVPKAKFEAKQFTHSYEVDTEAELCTRRVKLPVRITGADKVGEVLKLLCIKVPENAEETETAKD